MPYPIYSVVAVFKMLIRILNPLRSRIWDMAWFLFSDYLNPQLVRMEGLPRRLLNNSLFPQTKILISIWYQRTENQKFYIE